MAEKEHLSPERIPSSQKTQKEAGGIELKKPSSSTVLPKVWGENAKGFCDWCQSSGKIEKVDAIVADCLKKGDLSRLETFSELNGCPSDSKEYQDFFVSLSNEFNDVENEAERTKNVAEEAKQAKILRSVGERLSKPEYATVLQKAFPNGEVDFQNPEHLANRKNIDALKKAFANPTLREELFKAALANDAKTGGKDAEFFATQFRDLGVIDHAEWRKIVEESSKAKESPTEKNAPKDGRTALAGNFNSTGDGRTFFALDRTGSDGRKFDEFVRVSPDGKTASKEIVGKYGYSLTVEPVPLETGKTAAKESELATAQEEKGRIENQAKYVEETFGPGGSKIPSPEDPKFKDYKEAVDKIAKDKGVRIDEQDPKKTLVAVKDSIKTSYAQALEKTSKTQKELEELQKETAGSSVKDGEKNEKDARDAIDFLDRTGITALGPKATEELLRKFGAAGCENGKPTNLEKFLKGKNALATEFRTFVTNALGQEESALFKLEEVPPSLKPLFDKAGKPLELKSAFLEKGLIADDGSLKLEKTETSNTETQTA